MFLPLLTFMIRPQTKYHAHTVSESQIIRSKKGKIYRKVELILQRSFFSSLIFCWNCNRG